MLDIGSIYPTLQKVNKYDNVIIVVLKSQSKIFLTSQVTAFCKHLTSNFTFFPKKSDVPFFNDINHIACGECENLQPALGDW